MKDTGMIRKIDELGRIVIPKEIRKTLHINMGEPLEIFIDEVGSVVLKKYDPMIDFTQQISDYAESLSSVTGMIVAITNKREVLVASGIGKKEFDDRLLTEESINIIEKRALWSTKDNSPIPIVTDQDNVKLCNEAICPIIADSDVIGAVILICNDSSKTIGGTELKLLQVASRFLARQMV